MNTILINTAYFPPTHYFSHIIGASEILIEQFEHYQKQSYRNRCEILSANGVLTLSVPIKKGERLKVLTKDTLIEYATPWQKLHFKGIESAYKNSPYYDYYIDDFLPFFHKRERYLLDLNTKILERVFDILQLKSSINFTDEYQPHPEDLLDLRGAIHPKISKLTQKINFCAKPYYQTFGERFPFTPYLSILDLIFNMGPESSFHIPTH